MSNTTSIEELRKEIENLCGNCDRPNKEKLGEIILSSMALGFSYGINADRPQEWIPCSERLPSGEDAVLVSTCAFDAIYDVVFMMAKDVERFYECGHVNAWMPSPEPWKGADDEASD